MKKFEQKKNELQLRKRKYKMFIPKPEEPNVSERNILALNLNELRDVRRSAMLSLDRSHNLYEMLKKIRLEAQDL
jgi:hypothetical protein